jgi:hypothetical protein
VLLGFAIEAAGSTSTRKRLSLSAQLARGWPCASCDEHCSSRFARKENSKKKTDEDVNLGFKFGQFEPLLWAKFSCASKLLTFNHPGFGNTNDYWTPICGPFNLKNHWYVLIILATSWTFDLVNVSIRRLAIPGLSFNQCRK